MTDKQDLFNPKRKKKFLSRVHCEPGKKPELEIIGEEKSKKNKNFFEKKLKEDYGLKVETKKVPKSKKFIKSRKVFGKLKKRFKGREFELDEAWNYIKSKFDFSGRNSRLRKLHFQSKLRRMIKNYWVKEIEEDDKKKYKIYESRL